MAAKTHSQKPSSSQTAPNESASEDSMLPSGLDSGDIVLFNRRCTSMPVTGAALCFVAKLFSNSQWDHVGIVIRHPATGELLFLEADFGGVKLRSLEERVRRSRSNEIAVRRLSTVRNSSMREKFYAFAQDMIGRPYEIGTGSMLARVVDPLGRQERERLNALLLDKEAQVDEISRELDLNTHSSLTRRLLLSERARIRESCDRIRHQLKKELDVPNAFEKRFSPQSDQEDSTHSESDLSRVFCSELVAAGFQRAGLLGSYPPAFYYNPKNFSSEQTHPPGVHLLKAARLGPEVYIRKSARAGKDTSKGTGKRVLRDHGDGDTPARASRSFIRDALKRTPIYGMVADEYKRNHLVKSFRARIVEPGDVVFEQGQYGSQFFVVADGEVERFMQKGEEDPILVSTMGPRSTFGLTGFMYSTPRVSTVRAKKPTLLWELDRPTFELFRDAGSDIQSIRSAVDNRQLRGLLKDHFLFKRFDKIGAREVDAFFLVKFRAGETIFRQGEPGDNFYIIKNGELERHLRHPKSRSTRDEQAENFDPEGNSLVKTLHQGQSFGELSIMYDAPRAATVRARTDCECWAISTETFHQLNLSSGTQHLQAVFNKNASVTRRKQAYMTRADLLRFANVKEFPSADRERLAALLVSLVTSNRQRDPITSKDKLNEKNVGMKSPLSSDVEKASNQDDILMDFWEFVRFDIVLNQPSAEMAFAFLLADQNNSGFVSVDELENLLAAYEDEESTANPSWKNSESRLRRVFGRDGTKALSFREFTALSDDLLPPQFVHDVKTLTHHMLTMDVATTDHPRQSDVQDMAYVEPDGNVSMVGSQFMSAKSHSNGTHVEITTKAVRQQSPPSSWFDLSHLISVGISGVLSRTAVAPLERLKILMQVGGKQDFPRGWIECLRAMIRKDTSLVRALFRGNAANVIRIVPNAAIQLLMVDILRNAISTPGISGDEPDSNSGIRKGGAHSRMMEAVFIGGLSGMVAATAVYPIDFVRGRLTVQRRGFEPYQGPLHGLQQVLRREGFGTLYRGLGPSLAGVFPCVGLSFAIYETMRPILPKRNDQSGVPTTGSTIFSGIIATATGQVASFPFDTCRRRMQVAGFDVSGNVKATSFAGTWREIGQTMGWRGFFRGITPNLLKVAPASIVSFVSYEQVRGRLVSSDAS